MAGATMVGISSSGFTSRSRSRSLARRMTLCSTSSSSSFSCASAGAPVLRRALCYPSPAHCYRFRPRPYRRLPFGCAAGCGKAFRAPFLKLTSTISKGSTSSTYPMLITNRSIQAVATAGEQPPLFWQPWVSHYCSPCIQYIPYFKSFMLDAKLPSKLEDY